MMILLGIALVDAYVFLPGFLFSHSCPGLASRFHQSTPARGEHQN